MDDVVETVNHFRCIDFIIDTACKPLSERYIKEIHGMLKGGTTDSRKDWFAVGDYKRRPNEVGGMATALPEEVHGRMAALLEDYNGSAEKALEDLIDFHVRFERIHPFQDGNGRVGRLILFRECLKHGIVPFIIDERHKLYYYRGLKEWQRERGYLMDTCLSAQDQFKAVLDYFRIGLSAYRGTCFLVSCIQIKDLRNGGGEHVHTQGILHGQRLCGLPSGRLYHHFRDL